jgi:hypothetical protein
MSPRKLLFFLHPDVCRHAGVDEVAARCAAWQKRRVKRR